MSSSERSLRAHQHSGYVQTSPKGYFGTCSQGDCLWWGPDRETEHEADEDVAKHVATTGYPWNAARGAFDVG